MTEQTDQPVELTDSLDIEIAVDKYLTEMGIDFVYRQVPSGLDHDDLQRVILPNLKHPYNTDEKGMPIKFKVQFVRKDRILFETDYGQGIAFSPKAYYLQGKYGNSKNVQENAMAFDRLLRWINQARQGGRDLMKLTGFQFTHDFLCVSDFSELASRSSRKEMPIAESIAKNKGVKAARDHLSRNGYGEGVSAAGALSCLLSDARASEQTFEDWCGEFGYDSDSRKAEGIYRACDEIGKKLRYVFSSDSMNHMQQLVQNY